MVAARTSVARIMQANQANTVTCIASKISPAFYNLFYSFEEKKTSYEDMARRTDMNSIYWQLLFSRK